MKLTTYYLLSSHYYKLPYACSLNKNLQSTCFKVLFLVANRLIKPQRNFDLLIVPIKLITKTLTSSILFIKPLTIVKEQ